MVISCRNQYYLEKYEYLIVLYLLFFIVIREGEFLNLSFFVILRDFGHCNNLSARHATLFYDELSGQYELINYSPFGTQVDECLYSLDTAVITMR